MTSPSKLISLTLLATGLAAGGAAPAWAQQGATPVPPLTPAQQRGSAQVTTRSASIPAQGLFQGDQLSESTKRRLTDLIMDTIGERIELALLVPIGPWQIDGAGQGDTALNDARLRSLRRFLTDRGVDPNRIFVESRVDASVKSPRLDVQLMTTPAND
jgi:OmpA-OmpF porin, OOP family